MVVMVNAGIENVQKQRTIYTLGEIMPANIITVNGKEWYVPYDNMETFMNQLYLLAHQLSKDSNIAQGYGKDKDINMDWEPKELSKESEYPPGAVLAEKLERKSKESEWCKCKDPCMGCSVCSICDKPIHHPENLVSPKVIANYRWKASRYDEIRQVISKEPLDS